jgi:hypothetical protein
MSQLPPPPSQMPQPSQIPVPPQPVSEPMPPGGRISRGWHLVKVSWGVIKEDKELLWLPVISFIAIIIWWALATGVAVGLGGVPKTVTDAATGASSTQIPPVYYVVGFIALFVAAFITIFFNAALIGIAMLRLQGREAQLSDGFKLAISKLPKIIGWAVLTATVGTVLRALEQRAGIFGRIVIALVGAAWAIITFFVLPVLLFEQVGVFAAVKRSAHIFKERWGEQFTGNITISLVMFLFMIPILLVGGALALVFWPLGVVVIVVGVGGVMIVGSALSGVFNTALYRYATTGEAGGGFTEADLAGAFRPKKKGLFGLGSGSN